MNLDIALFVCYNSTELFENKVYIKDTINTAKHHME